MRMEGLIPFVYGVIKKRRATRRTMHYDLVSSPGGSPPRQTRERPPEQRYAAAAAHQHRPQSQSCRFVVPSSLADELHLLRDDDAGDGRGLSSRSLRFGSVRVLGNGLTWTGEKVVLLELAKTLRNWESLYKGEVLTKLKEMIRQLEELAIRPPRICWDGAMASASGVSTSQPSAQAYTVAIRPTEVAVQEERICAGANEPVNVLSVNVRVDPANLDVASEGM